MGRATGAVAGVRGVVAALFGPVNGETFISPLSARENSGTVVVGGLGTALFGPVNADTVASPLSVRVNAGTVGGVVAASFGRVTADTAGRHSSVRVKIGNGAGLVRDSFGRVRSGKGAGLVRDSFGHVISQALEEGKESCDACSEVMRIKPVSGLFLPRPTGNSIRVSGNSNFHQSLIFSWGNRLLPESIRINGGEHATYRIVANRTTRGL